MADILNDLKDWSEMLLNRRITLPKAGNTMATYVNRMESLSSYPGKHTVTTDQAEEAMAVKGGRVSAACLL